jgi:uncharacterized protein (DUF488 family)
MTTRDEHPEDEGGEPPCLAPRFSGLGTTVHTVGHGTLASEGLAALLHGAAIEQLVDVRAFPGSRHNPQYRREAMERWLPETGVRYRWLPELGGRRRPVEGSKHAALRNESFRAYADHMEGGDFGRGVELLLEAATAGSVAVLCSEAVWWRCHRRLLADHLALVRDVEVVHLLHDGRRTHHALTDGVRRVGDRLVYDVGTTPSLLEDADVGAEGPDR